MGAQSVESVAAQVAGKWGRGAGLGSGVKLRNGPCRKSSELIWDSKGNNGPGLVRMGRLRLLPLDLIWERGPPGPHGRTRPWLSGGRGPAQRWRGSKTPLGGVLPPHDLYEVKKRKFNYWVWSGSEWMWQLAWHMLMSVSEEKWCRV
jgi:hypothetical protein